ncbi:SgcJ/EcaC family oxidoreductase [Nonomuraea sp. 3-1Str]|uniref:SgcJ/EcaC family oxidoreductase n=1 Tax=Nonomuraea sp. 3-1Str TaxID=2929801 RepID=UPI002856C0D3|nr:SgcJ/EcaC family oxidoreductase [Nonomuraea sp. 3-1Str]MDR8409847.1 SgcJ/EcaC family oxidoreductase [Nonomuraea sp. 3-1Str]
MTGATAADVLAGLLDDWRRAFNGHRPAEMVALFSRNALFQGISPRLRHGPGEIFEYYDKVAPGTTAQVTVVSAARLEQAVVHGFAEVTFTAPTGDTHLVRLSVVAEQAGGTWLIHQYHAATRL